MALPARPDEHHVDFFLQDFRYVEPKFLPSVTSLSLKCTIPKDKYKNALLFRVTVDDTRRYAPVERITHLTLDGFSLGFPANWLAGLQYLFPKVTCLVFSGCRFVTIGRPFTGSNPFPHYEFLNYLSQLALRESGPLNMLSFRNVTVDDEFWGQISGMTEQGLRHIEITCTSGAEPDEDGLRMPYPILHLHHLVHYPLTTINFAVRPQGGFHCTALRVPVPNLVAVFADSVHNNLQLLDLTLVALQIEDLEMMLPMTPRLIIAKLAVGVPVDVNRLSTPSSPSSRLVKAFLPLKRLEDLEIMVAVSNDLIHATFLQPQDNRNRPALAMLPTREQFEELGETNKHLRNVDASIARSAFLGYVHWSRDWTA